MRVEQVSKGKYIKRPDRMTQYLMRVVQRFFETDDEQVMSDNSREAIVNEATRRAGAEIVRSVQGIVIDETEKYAANELNVQIDKKLADIVTNLNARVDELVGREIQPAKFMAQIEEGSLELAVPTHAQGVKVNQDIIFIFINGIAYDSAQLVSTGGLLTKIVFNEEDVEPGDDILFFAIMLNPEK